MKFAHFFVDRPIFAAVIAIFTVLIGGIAYVNLPVAQYPEIVPPTIVVRATYPGANAETIAQTVATPLEQEINGVEDMLYMSSQSTADGSMSLTITFKLGTDLNVAQVLVQNRVAVAEPRLPEEVRRLGVTTRKSSPDLMMVVHLLSPDNSHDQLYVSNYALLRVRDSLLRLSGVGDITVFGAREYSLRVWLDPERLAAFGLTASDAVKALQEQNVQVSGGTLGQPPANAGNSFQFTISTQGRFENPDQFKDVIVKAGSDGQLVRLKDVARVELGARDYGTNSYLDKQPAVGIGIFQRPGTNAVAGAKEIINTMENLKKDFPKGVEYRIVYNPTIFITESISEVYKTLAEALLVVALVVLVFLQSWRTAIIPLVAIPVSLIGTFAVMAAFGFSLNLLTLFGLILAIGIVVDDAIVVIENVERHIKEGKTPTEAAHITMDEVGGAVVAIALVLSAVFVPTAFVPGISGQFYKQFALTISVATIISAFNSLTLSPALAAILLKPHDENHTHHRSLLGRAADRFNRGFDWLSAKYSGLVTRLIHLLAIALIIYGVLLACTVGLAKLVPTGFIPPQDQGYAIVVLQLPDGAALARTDEVVHQALDIIKDTPGVQNAVAFAGFSGATFTNASNAGAIFTPLKPFDERVKAGQNIKSIVADLQKRLGGIQDAFIIVVEPPPVRGLGQGGGFKLEVKDLNGAGFIPTLDTAMAIMGQAAQDKRVTGVFTTFTAATPQVYLDIDREKAQILGVPISNIFDTLQINLGSSYVNDFNIFGRVYQVTAQADLPFRLQPDDIGKLKTVSSSGALVPLGSLVTIKNITGPSLVQRYNMATAIPVTGTAAPGVSTGDALNVMEQIAQKVLPSGMSFEWTELAFQEKQAGNAAAYILGLCVLFVFLLLAALYESWTLPLAIILIVPMSILCAFIGIYLRGMDNNILTQVGLVVLIGLAAKNAILIVEFAKDLEEKDGREPYAAITEAARLRLRPILMTSFAFILGVLPLMLATGPGSEMRQALGTAVFSGMFGVTFFGLVLTPVFYISMRKLSGMRKLRSQHAT